MGKRWRTFRLILRIAEIWFVVRPWRFIFKPAARYPADPRAIFILAVSVFVGITALVLGSEPNTLDALLPEWGVVLWSGLLVIGSCTTLFGMAIPNIDGIIIEQIGSVTVGATTIFYSGLAFWVVGPGALQGVGIILAWGLSCLIRWLQLQALLVNSYHKALGE